MAYGAAAPAVQLMWRLGILQLLMPLHAMYLEARGYPRYLVQLLFFSLSFLDIFFGLVSIQQVLPSSLVFVYLPPAVLSLIGIRCCSCLVRWFVKTHHWGVRDRSEMALLLMSSKYGHLLVQLGI
jgi:hypothetical protein